MTSERPDEQQGEGEQNRPPRGRRAAERQERTETTSEGDAVRETQERTEERPTEPQPPEAQAASPEEERPAEEPPPEAAAPPEPPLPPEPPAPPAPPGGPPPEEPQRRNVFVGMRDRIAAFPTYVKATLGGALGVLVVLVVLVALFAMEPWEPNGEQLAVGNDEEQTGDQTQTIYDRDGFQILVREQDAQRQGAAAAQPTPTPEAGATPEATDQQAAGEDGYKAQFLVLGPNNEPLQDAIVVLDGERFWADKNGYLHVWLAEGNYSAWAQVAGYDKATKDFTVTSDGAVTSFELTPVS